MGSCSALNSVSSLTQTELLQELTNECRYDKMVRPPGENNASDPIVVASRAYIYAIQSNMAKTLVMHFLLHIYNIPHTHAVTHMDPEFDENQVNDFSFVQ